MDSESSVSGQPSNGRKATMQNDISVLDQSGADVGSRT